MSLYYSTAPFLLPDESKGSFRTRVYNDQSPQLKSQPKHVYALASQAAKWSPVLAEVIENAHLLDVEPKVWTSLTVLGGSVAD